MIPHLDARRTAVGIGHSEIGSFAFEPDDEVWIGSYAPNDAGNRAMLTQLAARPVRHVSYISTATANIAATISCYRYPRVKAHAEATARELLDARIVRIGLVFDEVHELPAGTNAATALSGLAATMLGDAVAIGNDGIVHHYSLVTRPFNNALERLTQRLYGVVIGLTGRRPCVLRPIDRVFSLIGWRWYGYLYLSNRQCISMT